MALIQLAVTGETMSHCTESESSTLAYWQAVAPNLYLLHGCFESKLSPALISIKYHVVRSGPSLQSITRLRSLFPAWCDLYIGLVPRGDVVASSGWFSLSS